MKQITEIPELVQRKADGHKGDYGRVLVVGGCLGMSGAPALAGKAALRAGAGLVRIAVPKSILPVVAAIEPCYTTISLPEDKAGKISAKAVSIVLDAAVDNDVVAFGPGISIAKAAKDVLEALLRQDKIRLVIDADGLNNLCRVNGWFETKKAELILTPHPGEMKRLWKSVFRDEMPSDRIEAATKFAVETNTTTVLKGAGTIVSDCERYYVNTTGNPGMATAGAGDVLTGIIAALCGQGLCDFDAAVLAVHQHGKAGDVAAQKKGQSGMIASDIIEELKM